MKDGIVAECVPPAAEECNSWSYVLICTCLVRATRTVDPLVSLAHVLDYCSYIGKFTNLKGLTLVSITLECNYQFILLSARAGSYIAAIINS